jgi:predicted dehydrogenase
MAARVTTVSLIGAGRWGRQLLRVFNSRCRVVSCCHRGNPAVRPWLQEHYPHVEATVDYGQVLRDRRIDAVVIATPIGTHAELARRALEANKHVFVEKPLATSPAEANLLMTMARQQQRHLFVGHVFLYHPVLERIRHLTRAESIRYALMTWAKLGTFEEDLFWNLLSHEVSIAAALFAAPPSSATVLYEKGVVSACDIASVRLGFEGGRECVIHVNRCAPTPSKSMVLVTETGQVLQWDHDSLYRLGSAQTAELLYTSITEPLALEVEAFLRRIQSKDPTGPEDRRGLVVVEVVDRLLATRGREEQGRAPALVHPARPREVSWDELGSNRPPSRRTVRTAP